MTSNYSASSILYRNDPGCDPALGTETEFAVPTPPTIQPLEAIALASNFERTIGRVPTEDELSKLYSKIHADRIGAAMGILACQGKIDVGLVDSGEIGFSLNGGNAAEVLRFACAMTWTNCVRRGIDFVDRQVEVDRPMGTEGLPDPDVTDATPEEEAALENILRGIWQRVQSRKTA